MSELLTDLEKHWGRLLSPIPGDSPMGRYFVHELLYDHIKEARREDDPVIDQDKRDFDGKPNFKKADWLQVYRLCVEALTTQTKDLQIVVWLTEALLHTDGYAGFNQGLQLLIQLCNDNNWPNLFPPIEADGDLEARLAPLEWFNHDNFTRHSLYSVPITAPSSAEVAPYTFLDRQIAYQFEKILADKFKKGSEEEKEKARKEAVAAGRPVITQFLESVKSTSPSFYTNLVTELRETFRLIDTVKHNLTAYCKDQTPSFRKLLQNLETLQQVVNSFSQDSSTVSTTSGESKGEENLEEDSESATDRKKGTKPAALRSRLEAYRRLEEVANYLIKIEPHSPVPYLVKRAISWQDLTFTEVINELKMGGGESVYKLLEVPVEKTKKK